MRIHPQERIWWSPTLTATDSHGAPATIPVTALADIAPPRTVGMTREVKGVFLPGSALRVKADTSGRAPIALRLTEKYQHGNKGYRYDFAYTAFAPGTYRLSDWLEREDGSATGLLPPVEVTVESALAPGPPTRLFSLRRTPAW